MTAQTLCHCEEGAFPDDLYHAVASNPHLGEIASPLCGTHLCLPSRTGVPPVFAARTVRHTVLRSVQGWRRQ